MVRKPVHVFEAHAVKSNFYARREITDFPSVN